jgi:hypothetical protein
VGVGRSRKGHLKAVFEVRETAQRVAERSHLVRVNRKGVARFVEWLSLQEVQIPSWDNKHHFRGPDEETLVYLLVLDTLNFCFWPPPGKSRWGIQYKGKIFSGYYGLALCLKREMEESAPIIDAKFLASLSMEVLRRIVAGRGTLQLMERRLENLRELGRVLLQDFDGRPENLMASAHGSALDLARLLGQKLSSFRDVTRYGGEDVFFYKRGQLFAADLYGAFAGRSWGKFDDMDQLTAFADYKLPQVLRHAGVLQYAPSLAAKVDRLVLLEPGSPEEVEIRANTVHAVELIKENLARLGKKLKACEIDWVLWNLGQNDRYRSRPYHRTVTIFY